MHDKVIGPFFSENSITTDIYLDFLYEYVVVQLQDYQPLATFQQDDATPH